MHVLFCARLAQMWKLYNLLFSVFPDFEPLLHNSQEFPPSARQKKKTKHSCIIAIEPCCPEACSHPEAVKVHSFVNLHMTYLSLLPTFDSTLKQIKEPTRQTLG